MRDTQVRITAGSCTLTLNLPIFFEDATLTKIRKALSLLKVDPWENRDAVDALGSFLGEWIAELKENAPAVEAIEQAYKKSVRELESKIACFGTMATHEMRRALYEEQRQHKVAVQRLKCHQSILAKAEKIRLHYQSII